MTQTWSLRQQLSHIASFSGITMLSSIAPLVMLPVYVVYLVPLEYGKLALAWLFANFVALFSNAKLDQAMRTFFYQYENDNVAQQRYVSACVGASCLISIAMLCVILPFGPWLYSWFFSDDTLSFHPVVGLILCSTMFNAGIATWYVYLQNTQQFKLFACGKLSVVSINLLLQLLFVTQLQMSLMGIALAVFIASLVNLVIFVVLASRQLGWYFDWILLKPSLRFALPLILFSLFFYADRHADRFVLERLVSLDMLGVYALAIMASSALLLFFNALDTGFRAPLYTELQKQGAAQFLVTNLKRLRDIYIQTGYAVLSFLLCLCAIAIPLLENTKFNTAGPLLPLLLVSLLFSAHIRFSGLVFLYQKKSGSVTLATGVKLVIQLVLLWWFVSLWGVEGALVAIALGNLLQLVLYCQLAGNLSNSLRPNMNESVLILVYLASVALWWISQPKTYTNIALCIPLFVMLGVWVFKVRARLRLRGHSIESK